MRLIDIDSEEFIQQMYYPFNYETGEYEKFLVIRDDDIETLPTIDAIPVEWIKNRIETLNEYISKWGGSFEHEEMVNAYIHEVSALVRLINDWRKEE